MRHKGQTSYNSNFEVGIAGPLDARTLVSNYASLLLEDTWISHDGQSYIYKGMIVSVAEDEIADNNGLYQLLAFPVTVPENWIKLDKEITVSTDAEYAEGTSTILAPSVKQVKDNIANLLDDMYTFEPLVVSQLSKNGTPYLDQYAVGASSTLSSYAPYKATYAAGSSATSYRWISADTTMPEYFDVYFNRLTRLISFSFISDIHGRQYREYEVWGTKDQENWIKIGEGTLSYVGVSKAYTIPVTDVNVYYGFRIIALSVHTSGPDSLGYLSFKRIQPNGFQIIDDKVDLATDEEYTEGILTTKAPTVKQVVDSLATKQDTLVAGNNITIDPETNTISSTGSSSGAELATDEEYAEGILTTKAPTVKQVKSDINNTNNIVQNNESRITMLEVENSTYDVFKLLKTEEEVYNLPLTISDNTVSVPPFSAITSKGTTISITDTNIYSNPIEDDKILYYDNTHNIIKGCYAFNPPDEDIKETYRFTIDEVSASNSLSNSVGLAINDSLDDDWVSSTSFSGIVGTWFQVTIPKLQSLSTLSTLNVLGGMHDRSTYEANFVLINKDDTSTVIGSFVANQTEYYSLDLSDIDLTNAKYIRIICTKINSAGRMGITDIYYTLSLKNYLKIISNELEFKVNEYHNSVLTENADLVALGTILVNNEGIITNTQGYKLVEMTKENIISTDEEYAEGILTIKAPSVKQVRDDINPINAIIGARFFLKSLLEHSIVLDGTYELRESKINYEYLTIDIKDKFTTKRNSDYVIKDSTLYSLVPPLSSDDDGLPYITTASSNHNSTSQGARSVFKSSRGLWLNEAGKANNSWIKIKSDNGTFRTNMFTVYSIRESEGTLYRLPAQLQIQGSNDGTTWTTLVEDTVAWEIEEISRNYILDNYVEYNTIRLYFNGSQPEYIYISKFLIQDTQIHFGNIIRYNNETDNILTYPNLATLNFITNKQVGVTLLDTNIGIDIYGQEFDTISNKISYLINTKQDMLVAGDNITIDPETNTISSSGGGSSGTELATDEEWTTGEITTKAPNVKQVKSDINNKQTNLVSGENIKTLNGQSLLGTGNISTAEPIFYENLCVQHLNDTEIFYISQGSKGAYDWANIISTSSTFFFAQDTECAVRYNNVNADELTYINFGPTVSGTEKTTTFNIYIKLNNNETPILIHTETLEFQEHYKQITIAEEYRNNIEYVEWAIDSSLYATGCSALGIIKLTKNNPLLSTDEEWIEGTSIDKAPTVKQVVDSLSGKQDTLIAGNNITINPDTNTISSTGGGEVSLATDAEYTEGIINTKAPNVLQVKTDINNIEYINKITNNKITNLHDLITTTGNYTLSENISNFDTVICNFTKDFSQIRDEETQLKTTNSLVPPLLSNNSEGFIVTVDSRTREVDAYKPFNGSAERIAGGGWGPTTTAGNNDNTWLILEKEVGTLRTNMFTIYQGNNDASYIYTTINMTISGSNDGETWDILVTDNVAYPKEGSRVYYLDEYVEYKYFRFMCIEPNSNANSFSLYGFLIQDQKYHRYVGKFPYIVENNSIKEESFGEIYFNGNAVEVKELVSFVYIQGLNFNKATSYPLGAEIGWSSDIIPTGFLKLEGQSVPDNYPDLKLLFPDLLPNKPGYIIQATHHYEIDTIKIIGTPNNLGSILLWYSNYLPEGFLWTNGSVTPDEYPELKAIYETLPNIPNSIIQAKTLEQLYGITPADYITKIYPSTPEEIETSNGSWYIQWNSGRIEQGGEYVFGFSQGNISRIMNFLIPFTKNNYTLVIDNPVTTSSTGFYPIGVTTKTLTNFTYKLVNGQLYVDRINWQATGY